MRMHCIFSEFRVRLDNKQNLLFKSSILTDFAIYKWSRKSVMKLLVSLNHRGKQLNILIFLSFWGQYMKRNKRLFIRIQNCISSNIFICMLLIYIYLKIRYKVDVLLLIFNLFYLYVYITA